MTLVRETIDRGTLREPTRVTWTLHDAAGPTTGYIEAASPDGDLTAVGVETVALPSGPVVSYTVDLYPTSTIIPAGTRWVRTTPGHRPSLDPLTIIVPVTAAGVTVDAYDHLASPPTAILSPDDAALLYDRLALIELLLSAGFQTGGTPDQSSTVLTSGGPP